LSHSSGPHSLSAGEWANSDTLKTFNPFDFMAAIQFKFGFSSALGNTTMSKRRRDAAGAAELGSGEFGLADLFTPTLSDQIQIKLYQKINDTFPVEV
jgi:hypothetical protein